MVHGLNVTDPSRTKHNATKARPLQAAQIKSVTCVLLQTFRCRCPAMETHRTSSKLLGRRHALLNARGDALGQLGRAELRQKIIGPDTLHEVVVEYSAQGRMQ